MHPTYREYTPFAPRGVICTPLGDGCTPPSFRVAPHLWNSIKPVRYSQIEERSKASPLFGILRKGLEIQMRQSGGLPRQPIQKPVATFISVFQRKRKCTESLPVCRFRLCNHFYPLSVLLDIGYGGFAALCLHAETERVPYPRCICIRTIRKPDL